MNEQLYIKIKYILNELFHIPLNKIELNSNLKNDLNLDSLDRIDILNYIEKEYNIIINDSDKNVWKQFNNIKTIKDLIIFFNNKIGKTDGNR